MHQFSSSGSPNLARCCALSSLQGDSSSGRANLASLYTHPPCASAFQLGIAWNPAEGCSCDVWDTGVLGCCSVHLGLWSVSGILRVPRISAVLVCHGAKPESCTPSWRIFYGLSAQFLPTLVWPNSIFSIAKIEHYWKESWKIKASINRIYRYVISNYFTRKPEQTVWLVKGVYRRVVCLSRTFKMFLSFKIISLLGNQPQEMLWNLQNAFCTKMFFM